MTVYQAAANIGVGYSTLRRWEAKKIWGSYPWGRIPTAMYRARICKVYGITPETLIEALAEDLVKDLLVQTQTRLAQLDEQKWESNAQKRAKKGLP